MPEDNLADTIAFPKPPPAASWAGTIRPEPSTSASSARPGLAHFRTAEGDTGTREAEDGPNAHVGAPLNITYKITVPG